MSEERNRLCLSPVEFSYKSATVLSDVYRKPDVKTMDKVKWHRGRGIYCLFRTILLYRMHVI